MARKGSAAIITGGLGLIWSSLFYLISTPASSYYYIPLIFSFLILFISGIFEIREYYNKHLYQIVITTILVIMWLIIYIQSLSSGVDKTIYYIETGLFTILIIALIIYAPKTWGKIEKK